MSRTAWLRLLTLCQGLALGALVLWGGVVVYHLHRVGVVADLLRDTDPGADTYYIVYHFGPTTVILSSALGVLLAATLAKWVLSRRP